MNDHSPGTPAMRSDARRNYERLLHVAEDAFARQGVNASLTEVAKRAGVGIATLYRHFPTREALIDAVLRERFDRLSARGGELLESRSPEDALIAANFAEGAPRTRALAVFSSVSGLSLSAGLILGGLLTSLASWRWVMFVNVPVGVVIVALALRYVRPVAKHRTGLDVAGAVLGTAGMTAMVYGFVRAGEAGWGDRSALAALAVALVALVLFMVAEARVAHPLLPLGLFRDRNRAAAYLNMFLISATMLGMFFFLTQFLQTVEGFTPLATGIAFLPLAFTALVSARAVPWLLSRLGPKAVTASGTVAIAAGILWLTRLSAMSGYATGIAGPLILFGLGIGITFVPLNSFILAGLRPHQTGAAAATVQTMQQAGSSLGLAVLVTVFGAAVRDAAPGSPAGLADAIATSFAAASAFAACALAVAVMAVRRPG